jgi:predicted dehydrogenase
MNSANSIVRTGVIGLGNMGMSHARQLHDGQVPRARLTAVCNPSAGPLREFPGVAHFHEAAQLIRSGEIDAVVIATPHFSHVPIAIDALENGLHVLLEKPVGVHKNECLQLIAAHHGRSGQVFAAMFNQRTDPFYQEIRRLVRGGELGAVRRVNWIITNWFRTDAYYASSPWRATWRGEGGGVLLNQCPHNLDLLQWIFGMPESLHAFCRFGRYHDIEVEDDVTAYLEFPNGASGVFITTTGEAPGTNRLEITAERGKLVHQNDQLVFTRNEVETSRYCRTASDGFGAPTTTDVVIPVAGHGSQHLGILRNFTAAILDGATLLAPAAEGIHSVELANAMLHSTLTGRTIRFPLDGDAYHRQLDQLIARSQAGKQPRPADSD